MSKKSELLFRQIEDDKKMIREFIRAKLPEPLSTQLINAVHDICDKSFEHGYRKGRERDE